MNTVFRNSIIFCILISSLCACKADNDIIQIQQELKLAIEQSGFSGLTSKQVLFILPRTGCTGCINSAESFFMNDMDNYHDNINVLLTDINSLKTARIKFGSQLLDSESVFLDKKEVFDSKIIKSLYPIIIYLKNGEVVSYEYVSPHNPDAMDGLYAVLDSSSEQSGL